LCWFPVFGIREISGWNTVELADQGELTVHPHALRSALMGQLKDCFGTNLGSHDGLSSNIFGCRCPLALFNTNAGLSGGVTEPRFAADVNWAVAHDWPRGPAIGRRSGL
jgi:hypothetical protein